MPIARIVSSRAILLAAIAGTPLALADTWDNSAGNAQWSTATNWADNTEPTINDFVTFPNTFPGGQSVITLSSGEFAQSLTFLNNYTLSAGNIQLGNGSIGLGGGWSPTINSVLAGTGPITISGGGTLSLFPTSSNSYTGGTIISGTGTTVVIRTNAALGFNTAPITLNGGRLRLDGSVNPTFIVSRVITAGSTGATIELQNNALLDLFQGLGANAIPITFTGTSSCTVELNSSSARTGATTVTGLLLRLNNFQGLGSPGAANLTGGAVLEVNQNSGTFVGTVTANAGTTLRGGAGTHTFNGACNVGSGIVVLNGGPATTDTLILGSNGADVLRLGSTATLNVNSGTVHLDSANSYAGNWAIPGGTLRLAHPGGLGSGTGPVIVGANGLLSLDVPDFDLGITLNRRIRGIELLQNVTLRGPITCPDFGPSLVLVPFVGDHDATLTGPGASLDTVQAISLGGGEGRTVRVLNGAHVTSDTVFQFPSPSSPGGIIVNGAGSYWDCNGYLQIADNGPGSIAVDAGGAVSAETFFAGIDLEQGEVASAVVTGASSTLTCTNTLWIGYDQFDSNSGGVATLSVLDGADVTSGAAIVGYGRDANATATVSGLGSTWRVQNILEVGVAGHPSAALNITLDGQLSCGGLSLGNGSSGSGSCTISGTLSRLDCGSSGVLMSQDSAASLLHLRGGAVDIRGNITDAGPGLSTVLLDSATLDMHGFAIGAGESHIDDLQFRSGTLRNVLEINNGAGLTKIWPGTLTLDTPNTYTGITNINQGTLFVANTTGSATGIGLVNVASGAALAGPGRIGGIVGNDGVVAPGGFNGDPIGTLTFLYHFAQFAPGTLLIELAGEGVNDRADISGIAQLAGTLEVRLINGFVPAPGNTFTVLTASVIANQFPTTNLPALASGLVWQVEYLPTSVRLSVVSECIADVDDGSGTGTLDGGVTIDDLIYYLLIFEEGQPTADVDDGSGTGTPDGGVTIDDLLYYLVRFEAGC